MYSLADLGAWQALRTVISEKKRKSKTENQHQPLGRSQDAGQATQINSNQDCTHLWRESSRRQHLTDDLQASGHGLGLVQGQHQRAHFAAMTDGDIRHELHPSSDHCITLTTSDQANPWKQWGWIGSIAKVWRTTLLRFEHARAWVLESNREQASKLLDFNVR